MGAGQMHGFPPWWSQPRVVIGRCPCFWKRRIDQSGSGYKERESRKEKEREGRRKGEKDRRRLGDGENERKTKEIRGDRRVFCSKHW